MTRAVGAVSAKHAAIAAAKVARIMARREAQAVRERERRKAKQAPNVRVNEKPTRKPLGLTDLKAAAVARRARVA
jgi:hypothetical protein